MHDNHNNHKKPANIKRLYLASSLITEHGESGTLIREYKKKLVTQPHHTAFSYHMREGDFRHHFTGGKSTKYCFVAPSRHDICDCQKEN